MLSVAVDDVFVDDDVIQIYRQHFRHIYHTLPFGQIVDILHQYFDRLVFGWVVVDIDKPDVVHTCKVDLDLSHQIRDVDIVHTRIVEAFDLIFDEVFDLLNHADCIRTRDKPHIESNLQVDGVDNLFLISNRIVLGFSVSIVPLDIDGSHVTKSRIDDVHDPAVIPGKGR